MVMDGLEDKVTRRVLGMRIVIGIAACFLENQPASSAAKERYRGHVLVEFDSSDDFPCEIRTGPIEVEAYNREEARRGIATRFVLHHKRYVPSRPSEKFPDDRFSVQELKKVKQYQER